MKRGTVPNINTSSTLNMFGVPEDNIVSLQRMDFEVTKLLDNKNKGSISYNRPIRNRHELKDVSTPPITSNTSIFRRCQVIKNVISTSNHANDESSDEKIVERVLGIIDKNFNNAFFNYTV